MSARVHPAVQTADNNPTHGRFIRHSVWSFSPDHEQANNNVELPAENEVAEIPMKNRILHYFRWLANRPNADVSTSHLKQLVNEGADPSAKEEVTGTSPMHEVAAQWDVYVADFLVDQGANLNCTDREGRTPLHIAAYSNHTEMIEFLLDKGADPNYRTNIPRQTPVHFAVRGDSIDALEILIAREAQYSGRNSVDARGRTPLQLAAELDRDNTVSFLLTLEKNPARSDVVDQRGHPALVTLIIAMPQQACQALDQFHRVVPSQRYHEYKLNRIESASHMTETPFEAAVRAREYNVVTHPVMRKLIQQKWKSYARWYFFLYFGLYVFLVLVWTTLYTYPPVQSKHRYNFPTDIWRVILEIIGVLLLGTQIFEEIIEYFYSYSRTKRYKTWLKQRLKEDIANCSSTSIFDAEREYLQKSLHETIKIQTRYFTDPWNYIDVLTYTILTLEFILHLFDVAFHSEELALWVARFGAAGVILLWIKLLFYARASAFLGPLVAIIGQLSGNIAQYIIIIAVFYIPHVISFWVLFGGEQQTAANLTDPSPELVQPHRVAVMLFRMSLVDDYPYETLRSIDELTSTILVISFLFVTAVIGLNLFIALLSDTFQRVYDNAKANAELQKAQLVLSLQAKSSKRSRRKFFEYLNKHCAPLRDSYDDSEVDGNEDASLTKITHQIHKMVKKLISMTEEDQDGQIGTLKASVEQIENKIEEISDQLEEIKNLLTVSEPRQPQQTVPNSLQNSGVSDDFSTRPTIPPLLAETRFSSRPYDEFSSRRTIKGKTKIRKISVAAQPQLPPSVYQGHRRARRPAFDMSMQLQESDDEDVYN